MLKKRCMNTWPIFRIISTKEHKKNEQAPFYDLEDEQIELIYTRARKNSDRFKRLKKAGKSEKYIDSVFKAKAPMKVFSWRGEIDTIMSPNDSIKYYKFFLRSGLLSIEPQTGTSKLGLVESIIST